MTEDKIKFFDSFIAFSNGRSGSREEWDQEDEPKPKRIKKGKNEPKLSKV